MLTDPIANRPRRPGSAYVPVHREVNAPRSRIKDSPAPTLKREGSVDDEPFNEGVIKTPLKSQRGKAAITGLRRISKPGRRVFVRAGDIPRVQNGLGICILSTSSGVLDGEAAKEKKVGGELLCEIW